ncbi:hypothetical protein [Desulfitobacterium sp. AusDCA]|uniref:hypothetical protein n=1 Tax=Desulfitobacterium sp. AusDCA TaxID=3240383 RepID=UPI003DA798D7
MPILYVIAIGIFLWSSKGKLKSLWNTTVTVLIWLNVGALVWKLSPPLHPLVLNFWNKMISPYFSFLQPFGIILKNLVVNLLKLLSGVEVK